MLEARDGEESVRARGREAEARLRVYARARRGHGTSLIRDRTGWKWRSQRVARERRAAR
jgi:hypothetical protein